MNVDNAATALARKYPGGTKALADEMGMSVALLNAKLNPNTTQNVLNLHDAIRMTDISGDLRILQAWAAQENCRLVPAAATPAADIVSMLLEQNEHEGTFAKVLRESLADGVITSNELAAIERAGGDLQGVLMKLLRQLHAMTAQVPEVSR